MARKHPLLAGAKMAEARNQSREELVGFRVGFGASFGGLTCREGTAFGRAFEGPNAAAGCRVCGLCTGADEFFNLRSRGLNKFVHSSSRTTSSKA